MKRLLYVVGMTAVIILAATSSWAEKAYVTDRLKITFRSGPSLENKVIRTLSSGQELEVLNTEGDWSHVRIAGEGEEGIDGWILNRYLIERLPWEKKAGILEAQKTELAARLAMIGVEGQSPQSVMLPPPIERTFEPRTNLRDAYEAYYRRFTKSYSALKEVL